MRVELLFVKSSSISFRENVEEEEKEKEEEGKAALRYTETFWTRRRKQKNASVEYIAYIRLFATNERGDRGTLTQLFLPSLASRFFALIANGFDRRR